MYSKGNGWYHRIRQVLLRMPWLSSKMATGTLGRWGWETIFNCQKHFTSTRLSVWRDYHCSSVLLYEGTILKSLTYHLLLWHCWIFIKLLSHRAVTVRWNLSYLQYRMDLFICSANPAFAGCRWKHVNTFLSWWMPQRTGSKCEMTRFNRSDSFWNLTLIASPFKTQVTLIYRYEHLETVYHHERPR